MQDEFLQVTSAIHLLPLLHLLRLADIIFCGCVCPSPRHFKLGKIMANPRRKPVANPSAQTPKIATPSPPAHTGSGVEVYVNGVRLEVSPILEAAVQRAYKALARPLPSEMTTNQAAEVLDVSRPFIIKLVKRGELPCRMVGKHRRIPTDALLEYRDKMFQRANAAADEMARISQELGLYDLGEAPPGGQ
jgi:excisionase family DNA binding protein